MFSSDIYFIIPKFNIFINKDTNVQYTISRQKEIARLFEKKVFKIITFENIPSNT